jgi:hypothetical protein
MGGYGSGRIGEKTLTSQMMELDVRELYRHGYVQKSASSYAELQHKGINEYRNILIYFDSEQLTINYSYERYSGDRKRVNTIVQFDWTPCHYGGFRPWFLCPKCGKRVAILYGGKHFNYRICRKLAYPSENESKASRLLRKANNIKRRLNGEPGVQNMIMFKPKGMHQKTFDRLVREVYALENMAVQQLSQKLKRNQDLQI